jgi:class 3 adenylate cyclase
VGFTAWSSTRDPAQVFVLLETLYGAFDTIARRRRVFKVETIGDCYVAVTGLPRPRRDHALSMARFAHDCLVKSSEVFHCLEVALGPGTSRLNIRTGLHSGPVTAGVLRGEKGRFQLFGDTVNTASRMESNSSTGKILCSKETADLISAGGKPQWLSERKDKVIAKGKGEMITYWITVKSVGSDGETLLTGGSSEISQGDAFGTIQGLNDSILPLSTRQNCKKSLSKQHTRLVNWNVELLASLLTTVVASRKVDGKKSVKARSSEPTLQPSKAGHMPFDEWTQSIDLPSSTKHMGKSARSTAAVLPEVVINQLRHFVTAIALLHGDNPFPHVSYG